VVLGAATRPYQTARVPPVLRERPLRTTGRRRQCGQSRPTRTCRPGRGGDGRGWPRSADGEDEKVGRCSSVSPSPTWPPVECRRRHTRVEHLGRRSQRGAGSAEARSTAEPSGTALITSARDVLARLVGGRGGQRRNRHLLSRRPFTATRTHCVPVLSIIGRSIDHNVVLGRRTHGGGVQDDMS
jgi:hypothetical protein